MVSWVEGTTLLMIPNTLCNEVFILVSHGTILLLCVAMEPISTMKTTSTINTFSPQGAGGPRLLCRAPQCSLPPGH